MNDDLYQMYMDEIEAITPCSREENARLLMAAATGDGAAKNRLVEGNFKTALAPVEDYKGRGVAPGDLVQEANMALVLAVEDFGKLAAGADPDRLAAPDSAPKGAFEAYLEERVKAALTAAVEEQAAEKNVAQEMLARVNVLKDVSQNMAEELGREASVKELAERMKMSVDEVKDIMKLTLDAMSVTGDYGEEE